MTRQHKKRRGLSRRMRLLVTGVAALVGLAGIGVVVVYEIGRAHV